jgi:hypothetical protein
MADEAAPPGEEEQVDPAAFVVAQMQAGTDQETIVARLTERGVEPSQAREVVDTVYPEVMRAAEAELVEPRALIPAAVAGLLAAIAGGIVWAFIVVKTNYEIGFAAVGIGVLAGFAVVFATRGRKGLPLQVTAVIASALGIVLGKYFSYVWEFRDAVREAFGDEAADEVSAFDTEMVRFFFEDADRIFSFYDLLWFGFAMYAAWRIPRSMGIAVRRGPISGI